ncbi:MAG: hypothetical protein RIA64_08925 [Rhodospirillales bacterium]
MSELHLIYMRHAISQIQHDAIMAEAERYGAETPKQFLNMIVSSEICRMVDHFKEGLTDEEITAYAQRESDQRDKKQAQSDTRSSDLNDVIPF